MFPGVWIKKNAVVFDRRTLSSDFPEYLRSSGHHRWQWSASGFLQATQLISRAALAAECHNHKINNESETVQQKGRTSFDAKNNTACASFGPNSGSMEKVVGKLICH